MGGIPGPYCRILVPIMPRTEFLKNAPRPRPWRIPAGLACALALAAPALGAFQETDGPEHFGAYLQTLEDFQRPGPVAFDNQGNLWICEVDGSRVVAYQPSGDLVHSVIWPRNSQPEDLWVESKDRVWLSDGWNHKVYRLNGMGVATLALGGPPTEKDGEAGSGAGELLYPEGLFVRNGEVWVADKGNGRIAIFSGDGKYLRSIGEGVLESPRAMAFDERGHVAVVDSGLAQVVVMDAKGQEQYRFGNWGWFPGLFSDPTDIVFHQAHTAKGSPGRWYVADRENQRVQVFARDGKPLYLVGRHAILPREGQGKLHYPSRIAISPSGDRMAIAEPLDGRVQIFGSSPGAEPKPDPLRPPGGQPTPHYGPRMALGFGLLAIPVPEEHRVRIYDMRLFPGQDPVQVLAIGGHGRELGMFREPAGMDWQAGPSASGHPVLWVCDRQNRRLVAAELALSPDAPLEQNPKAAKFLQAFDLNAWNQNRPLDRRLQKPLDPVDLCFRSDGTLLVLCAANRTVLGFDSSWNEVLRIQGGPDLAMLAPTSLAWHGDSGRLAVTDTGFGWVLVFDEKGTPLFQAGEGHLRRPSGVAFDPEGILWVTDRWQSEEFSFDGEGKLLGRRFRPGLGRDGLFGPADLVFDGEGRHIILDHGNHRAMVFDSEGEWVTAFGSKLYTKPARLPHAPKHPEESE